MNKYTAEEIEECAKAAEGFNEPTISRMLRDYAALLREREIINSLHVENDKLVIDREKLHSSPKYLSQIQAAEELRRFRERESAKAAVTDEMTFIACDQIWVGRERESNMPRMRRALEAVAPMLASARVLDGWRDAMERALPFLDDEAAKYEDDGNNEPLDVADTIRALLAAAPKPETEE